MFRSRMPYIRWHPKEKLIRERMKSAMSPRYYQLQPESADSSSSSSSYDYDNSYQSEDATYDSEDEIGTRRQDGTVEMWGSGSMTLSSAARLTKRSDKSRRSRPVLTKQAIRQRQIPGPGVYEPYRSQPAEVLPRKEQPFTKSPQVTRSLTRSTSTVGPGLYNPVPTYSKVTSVASKGCFDSSNEIRCGQIKSGYLAAMQPISTGPVFTNFPTSLDIMKSPRNANNGKFSKTPRKPRLGNRKMNFEARGCKESEDCVCNYRPLITACNQCH